MGKEKQRWWTHNPPPLLFLSILILCQNKLREEEGVKMVTNPIIYYL
jgi:hypothetical protein